MNLSAGTRIGPHEVQSLLGEGGMGQVYRARDTRLNRDVAIKVLLPAVASDPDRLARFSREAQILAALNHPHIAQVYGLEETSELRAIVMELVEGPTLADQVARGALPVPDALAIASQIAEALAAAHDQGIVHRDLKPANIKLRPDGTVKVLDFGLARTGATGATGTTGAVHLQAQNSPTFTSPVLTMHGMLLGTAAYMSPEQAMGQVADRRSDLWSFGAVLFEMLTGRAPFDGDNVAQVLASVLKSEPDWSALPAATPPGIRRLLARCLQKDRRRRLESAADARLEIDEALSSPSTGAAAPVTVPARPSRRIVPLGLAAVGGAIVAAITAWVWIGRQPASPGEPIRLSMPFARSQPLRISPFERSFAIAPNGRRIVYSTVGGGTGGLLLMRALDQLEPQPVNGTSNARQPFFSPDGEWIGFFDGTDLKKIAATGGTAVTLCQIVGAPRGGAWIDNNTIVFASSDPRTGLFRVAAGGGAPVPITTPDEAGGDHVFPSTLPAARGVLFAIVPPGQAESSSIAVLDLKSSQQKTLLRGGNQPEYVTSGHLVYAVSGTLRAVRFDTDTLELAGDAVPVVDSVESVRTGAAYSAISPSGTLVYLPAASQMASRVLAWVDRQGNETPITAPRRAYALARLSPDGTRVALDIRDDEDDVWIFDLSRETMIKVTYGSADEGHPVWSSDGRRILFVSNRDGAFNVFGTAADATGDAVRITTSTSSQFPTSLVRDALVGYADGPGSFDIVRFDLSGAGAAAGKPGRAAETIVATSAIEHNPALSPNGRYLAYQSNESGRFEVYVRPFPAVQGGRWMVSDGGGDRPLWSPRGDELFYERDGAVMAMPVDTSRPTFVWSKPARLFDYREIEGVTDRTYDVAPDGRRFLMIKDPAATAGESSRTLTVVLNWTEELKARAR